MREKGERKRGGKDSVEQEANQRKKKREINDVARTNR
jgi:hypothetical protein